MSRKPKVYGGNLDGVHRVIMATTSLTAFCKATDVSRSYACETGNAIEREVALSEPGVIFIREDRPGYPYRSLASVPLRWSDVTAYTEAAAKEVERRG